jgi:hypothetical protein
VSGDAPASRSAPRRLRGCAALVAIALLALVVACGAGAAGVKRGWVAPPLASKQIGPVTLYSVVTLDPECPLTFCGTQRITSAMQLYYMVWVVVVWPGEKEPVVRSYTLVVTPIER